MRREILCNERSAAKRGSLFVIPIINSLNALPVSGSMVEESRSWYFVARKEIATMVARMQAITDKQLRESVVTQIDWEPAGDRAGA